MSCRNVIGALSIEYCNDVHFGFVCFEEPFSWAFIDRSDGRVSIETP